MWLYEEGIRERYVILMLLGWRSGSVDQMTSRVFTVDEENTLEAHTVGSASKPVVLESQLEFKFHRLTLRGGLSARRHLSCT